MHIGDVHFPDSRKETQADIKDLAFPSVVTNAMLVHPLQSVVRAASLELERTTIHGIVFSGDLTSRGSVEGYKSCLDYLSSALNLRRWKADQLHAVPGNHDVDRNAIDPNGSDLSTKFASLESAWKTCDLPILATTHVRATELKSHKNTLNLYSLNSSIGCGERRHLPEKICRELQALLRDYVSRSGWEAAFQVVGETLDTPGFRLADIEDLCTRIQSLDIHRVLIVVSHHNLLPQALLRVELYTEVLNAGLMRSRFTGLQRSIVYCHGHIHDNPVEIISDPSRLLLRVISISAPEFSRGFNILEIEFGAQNFPLGCQLTRHELNPRDGEIARTETSITLFPPGYRHARTIGHPQLRQILGVLPEAEIRFGEAVERLRKVGFTANAQTIAAAIREGYWLGVLELTDRHASHEYWRLRKVGTL